MTLEEVPVALRGRLPSGTVPAALLLAMVFRPELAMAVSVLPPMQARLVGSYSRFLLRALEIALARAAARLSDERCRNVLDEFADPTGRRLSDTLVATGQEAGDYLSGLVFRDGEASRPCLNDVILAWTSPGSRTVYLCGIRFAVAAHRDTELAAAILIHEGFHTLGLSENPPSSVEITARIERRCRR
jgi:hypothetical protein